MGIRKSMPRAATMKTRALPLLLAAVALAPAAAPAQEPLPDAQQIMARYIDALGGEAALRKHTYRHDRITMDMPAQGITMTMEVFAAAPDRVVSRIEIPGMGSVSSGYDGEVAWMIHPATGPMLLDGTALEQHRQEADFYGPLEQDEYVKSLETVERTDFEGRDCYKVRVVTNWDEEYFEFYDAATGLLAGSTRSPESPMGAMQVTTIVNEYREVDGVHMPAKLTQRAMGIEQIITITITSSSFETLDDSVFELPPEIEALVDGK